MKLLLPKNTFSEFFEKLIDKNNIDEVNYLPSSQISKALELDSDSFGLIPSCDLLTHHDLNISSKLGISFDGLISPSYFYFSNNFGADAKVHVYGDVTSNDLILSKILINERYDIDIELILETKPRNETIENFLICGDENFKSNLFERGISFADQVAEYMNMPYVNYVMVSKNEEIIKEINRQSLNFDMKFEDSIENLLTQSTFSNEVKEFINLNIGSIYFAMTDIETESLSETIKLPYYHGMIKDLHELKFID